MKAKRNLFVSLVTLTLLLCCSMLFVACSSDASAIDNDTVSSQADCIAAESLVASSGDADLDSGDTVTSQAECTNTDNLALATAQRATTVDKSNSQKSAARASTSSTKTGIYIGGGEITSDRHNGGGWSYNFSTNTLTLNGYYSATSLDSTLGLTHERFPDFSGKSSQAHLAIDSSVCSSLNIKVKGEYASYFGDIDDADDYDKDGSIYYGIYAPGVDLIIDIEDDYAPMKYNPTYYPLQIYTHRDAVYCKNLTLTGGGGLRADSCIGSGINCHDLSATYNRIIARTQHGNNIYNGIIGHATAAILATGSVTFTGASVDVYVHNTAPKVGSIWAAFPIDVYGIKAGSLNIKGGAGVTVDMAFISDVTKNVTFKATGIYASSCTSYDGGRLYTKITTHDTMPDNAYLSGFNIEDYAYFLGGNTTIQGELIKSGSKSFKLESFMHSFPLPFGTMSTSIEDTKYNYTANISALYLRNNIGTLQYARNILFNDAITLSSSIIDMADFADVNGYNVYSVSGDWKIKPIAGDTTSTFVALDDSISLELGGGNTYGAFNLYTYTGATIYFSGDGIVNSLNADGCNELGVRRFVSYGSVNFRGGTVKSGWINSGCDVIFYGGNINVAYEDTSESSPYRKWTFDFGEYADSVNFQTDLSFSSGSYDSTGLYPIDGKLYSWDKYQTVGLSSRLFKYAVVNPTDGYMYYLYPTAAEAERTFSMYRLVETDVFVGGNADTKYYLADGDTLTISVGTFAKQVTRPVTTFGGSTSTEILQGSTTTTVPDGFTVNWTCTDRDGKVTKLGSGLSLTEQVKALKDDGSVYTCSIRQGNTQVSEFNASVFVFDYNPTGLAPKLVGKDETKSFTFSFDDFKGYNDWIANNYNFIWQKNEDGSGFVDIAGTENQNTFSVTVESDDSYKVLYRVRCYSSKYYVSGTAFKSYPTYYTTTTNLTFRELPYFSGGLSVSPADNYAGVTKYFSINLKNCYMGVVDCWYEYSTDDGETWQRALDNPAFKSGLSIIFSTKYLSPYGNSEVTDSWYGSLGVEVTFTTEMNGWKLRCVMRSGDYTVYSNEATFTVLDFAGFIVQPESTVTLTSSDSLSLTAAFDEDYTDGDGNGISDVTYEWIYETWSNGNYDKVNTENKITATTLYYENVSGIGSVSRYRLQVKFKYKNVNYTRYSDYAYVYILFPPAFDDGGVVISNMADGIYTEGDGASWKVDDNGVFFHYYKTYQFEISTDGGDTWQSVGDVFTQSYLNTVFTFDLQNLTVADGGLYRCKVSISKNDLTVCSYSDVVSVGVISDLSIDDSQGLAATSTGKFIMSAKHEYSSNVSVTYQWQGYDSVLGWVELASENYFDTDKQAMYMFGASLPSYEKYRCFVGYKLNDDISVTVYTNEVAPVLVLAPIITAEPVDQTVWLGSAVKFILQIDNPTTNYTVLWEISNDGGVTWESAVAPIQCEAGETDYSLLCNTTTHGMNGAMFRCTVTNAIGDVFESVVTEPVTLTVRSGYVKTEQELLDALRNGMTEFKLLDDISPSATVIVNNNITLDLAGHILSYQNSEASGSVIRIVNDAYLTITDSDPGAVHSNTDLPLGGLISGGTGCVLSADDGSLGGGVLIEKGGLIFAGGTVYDCRATYGGGIYVSALSYLSLEGGSVENCNATEGGGIHSESDIDIKDGGITNCTSSGTESNGKSDALYLKESTLNASGGIVDGTVHLKESAVVMPEGSVSSTTFNRNVYCDNSAIKGGFYLSDVEGADTSNSFTVTYLNGDQTVTKLVVERGQKAIAVSLPAYDGYMYVWLNGDVAYDFDKQVVADLVLRAQWYVTAEVADDLTDKLDKTQTELDNTKTELDETNAELDNTKSELSDTKSELGKTQTELDDTKSELSDTKSELGKTQTEVADAQSKIDSLNGDLSGATENIEELNDKLSSVTAWMIVSIVLFGLSCGAIVPLLMFFLRKKGIK